MASNYDTLYQDWLNARAAHDYMTADRIRTQFERDHKLTIFAVGEMPIEGVTVRRMKASDWESKYGNQAVGRLIATEDSKVRRLYPDYQGLK